MKERAGFGIRLVALAIDCILLIAISSAIGLMAGSSVAVLVHKAGFLNAGGDRAAAAVSNALVGVGVFALVTALVSLLLTLPYNMMEALVGWTPGKLVTGLRVCNEDGSRPTFLQVFSRWLIKHNAILLWVLSWSGIPFMVLSPVGQVLVFGGCFMALTSARQALHDKLTGTAVYELSQLQRQEDGSPL